MNMNDRLATTLRTFRLRGMTQSLDLRLQKAVGHGSRHMAYLELILQNGVAVREKPRVQRCIKSADFRELNTIGQFGFPSGDQPTLVLLRGYLLVATIFHDR